MADLKTVLIEKSCNLKCSSLKKREEIPCENYAIILSKKMNLKKPYGKFFKLEKLKNSILKMKTI